MKRLLLLLLTAVVALGQGWYQIATPTNSLTCTFTNLNFTPTLYNVYWFTNGSAIVRRHQSPALPVPYWNFMSNQPPGFYYVWMSGTSAGGVESMPSTNIYVLWSPPPTVPGAPIGVTTK